MATDELTAEQIERARCWLHDGDYGEEVELKDLLSLCDEVLALRADRDRLREERDALREELAKVTVERDGALDNAVNTIKSLERELAEARAEIAKMEQRDEESPDPCHQRVVDAIVQAKAASVQVGREQRQWEIKSMLESMPLLANWTPGQTMRFMLEQIAAMAPPAETTGDPYRYGPNQVGNRKE